MLTMSAPSTRIDCGCSTTWARGKAAEHDDYRMLTGHSRIKDTRIALELFFFFLISWERGSPLLNAHPRKIPFRERASHAVRFSLSHFAWILATQLSTGLLTARNRSSAVVRSVCAIRSSGTVGDANRRMMKITTGSKFAAAPVSFANSPLPSFPFSRPLTPTTA